jgi:type IV pilus assembly protein PilA
VLKHLKERRQSEEGFTLIELMVVVLIMGILMAIAIPTFLATQGSAHDAAAKSNATNVFTNEKAYFEDNQVFLDAGSTNNGSTLDANLPWGANATAAAAGKVVAEAGATAAGVFTETATAGGTGVALVVMASSQSGDCFYIEDDETTSTTPVIAYGETSGGCVAPAKLAITGGVASGNAGAHIATAALTTGNWYASW